MTQSNKSTKTSEGKKTHVFTEYGYLPDGDSVAPEYLVRITSIRNKASVIGLLQEDIAMRVESRWDSFIPTAILAKGNILAQAISTVFGDTKSLISKATTRRIWVGSTPMTLSLKLKFEAINDSSKDVVEPCRILQSLALPSEPKGEEEVTAGEFTRIKEKGGIVKALAALPLLTPPGPSPFSLEGMISSRKAISGSNITSIIEGSKGGDRIILQLGKFLRFDDVIVREVSTAYHIKMDKKGNPISADTTVVFETYEIPTVQSLEKAYEKTALFGKPVEESGRREFHITTFG